MTLEGPGSFRLHVLGTCALACEFLYRVEMGVVVGLEQKQCQSDIVE